jgi:hypothetical protein
MRAGMLIFMFMLWLIALLLTSSYEQYDPSNASYFATEGGSRLNYAMDLKNIVYNTNGLGSAVFVGLNTQYFNNLWQMLTFQDATFFTGWLTLLRMFLLCITAAIMFALAMGFIYLLQGLVNLIKP